MLLYNEDFIRCNCCGRKITIDNYNNCDLIDKFWYDAKRKQIVNINIQDRGYGSIFDGMDLNFNICEKCLYSLFRTFKIKPDVINPCPNCGEELTWGYDMEGLRCTECEYKEKAE